MTRTASESDVEWFRLVIARRLGLQFDDSKTGFLSDVLQRRSDAAGTPAGLYLAQLETESGAGEVRTLAKELTVPETHFFRNIDQFRAFTDLVLPTRMATGHSRRLHLLSAGCASGEEPYTLAMLTRQLVADGWNVAITAIDINSAAIARATDGRFTRWSLRETSPEVERRWFRGVGNDVVLDEAIRRAVKFEIRNLAEDDAALWRPGTYDAVFCRNVIMYFTTEVAERVVARIARALIPGGHLFLGHAETLRGLSHDFHLVHTHGTFYYQLRAGTEQDTAPAKFARRAADVPRGPSALELASLVDGAATWIDAIQKASERIKTSAEQRPAAVAPVADRPRWDLASVRDLLERERFAEALAVVNALPPESERDPDVLLLQGVLLTHAGRLAEAEAACRRLLSFDELNAGAHYVLALCREAAGDTNGASEHDEVSVYLDPTFAMPRLHLGLLARRGSNREGARRELTRALPLLQREDASRLLLFGGGFNREALTVLCRAELVACGGRP